MTETPPIPRVAGDGWIVLIGGGEFSFGETREIDQFLVSKLPLENRRIAFLPTASGSNQYAIHLGKYFRELAADVDLINVPIYRHRDARRGKNLDLLRSAGMIYLGGGVTNLFVDVILHSPAAEALRQAIEGGVTIAAIGAAAMVLGRFGRDMHRPGGAVEGLNWIVDSAVETGFEASNDAELRRLMSIRQIRLGIGIPAKTALAIRPDGVGEILGGGPIALVRKPTGAAMQ